MNVTNFPNYLGAGQPPAASPVASLASMASGRAGSPLEAAQRALADAKIRLELHRDEALEAALDGYLALRARQTSYESELDVQWKQLEAFQTLSGRREALSEELSAARAEYEASAAAEAAPDIASRLSLAVDSLANELAGVARDISDLVGQAGRYASSRRQYADYLEKTGQGGYAAFEYRPAAEYTEAAFMAETADVISRLEAGARQWQERVAGYCGQYGRTPYEFECYLQERRELGDAYAAARRRLAELWYAAEGVPPEGGGPADPLQDAASGKARFDTVELGEAPPEEPFPLF